MKKFRKWAKRYKVKVVGITIIVGAIILYGITILWGIYEKTI
ncbi:MAG: hypothetical protein NTY80_00825 [candidate division SR1 bacterium]|nr:hypothetical protein [candidate division SR1 bacterium]